MRIYQKKVYYLGFAAGFYMLWFLFKLGGMPDLKQAVPSTAIDVVISLFCLYISVEYLLPRFVYKKKYGYFILLTGSMVLVAGSVIILSQLKLMGSSVFAYRRNIAKYQEHFFYWFWSDLIFGSYCLVAFIALAGCAIRLVFDRIVAERKVETLEKQKISSELMMLKHQINPHFLFNALNTIFYKIDKSNLAARKILEQFSSLLRYQLYECNMPMVRVEKEMEFLQNYIEVQAQRLNGEIKIDCRGFEGVKGFQISPYLLVPLVENCFKHVYASGQNGYILIECGLEGHFFWLYAENSSNSQVGENKEGIGLANICKRLEITYPGRHILQLDSEEDVFKVKLQLDVQ
jgi:two-component system, LytTR family, sensor kinase